MAVDYNKYPWLCPTIPEYEAGCDQTSAANRPTSETNLATGVTIEGVDLYGIPCVYYYVTHDIAYDVHYGEDQLEWIARAFNFRGYIKQMPSNVRTYQLEGIWGEDLVEMYVANTAFRYFSTYGGEDRNIPEVYDQIIPRIGDIIYIPANKTFYEIRNVNYYTEAFGVTPHTYTLKLKVYKDTKCTISADNPTLKLTESRPYDPIYNVAPSALSAQDQYHDPLQLNDELQNLDKSKTVDTFNYVYENDALQ